MILMPARMEQINILIHREEIEKVTDALIGVGAVHLVEAPEIEHWSSCLGEVETRGLISRYSDLWSRAELLASKLGIKASGKPAGIAAGPVAKTDLEKTEKEIGEMEAQVSSLVARRESLEEEKKKLVEMRRQLGALEGSFSLLENRSGYSFLEILPGFLEEKKFPVLERCLHRVPHVIVPGRKEGENIYLMAVVLKSDHSVLAGAAREANLQAVDLSEMGEEISRDTVGKIDREIEEVRKEIEKADVELEEKKNACAGVLSDIIESLRLGQVTARARGYFRRTENTCFLSGWIPHEDREKVVKAVETASCGKCYIEWIDPEERTDFSTGELEVPVLFRNPKFLQPFELLVSAYGLPRYRTIDPTLFVAVTYLIMFGVMFGDVGDGLVLGVVGTLLGFSRRMKESWRRIGKLMLYSGVSSLLFGFLYGSVFGVEHFLPALWMRPLENVTDFFKMAIYFGIAVVSIGILINMVNAIFSRNWIECFLDKAGLMGGLIYWGGVGIVSKGLVSGFHTVSMWAVTGLIFLPLALLFLKGPVQHLVDSSKPSFPEGFLTYFMEHAVESLEIFMGYLANTVSFIRVAAFALSHAGLFIAIFSLVDTINDVAAGFHGTILTILTLVLGNAIVIVLEGLIVAVQCARLEYYEFFGKFFTRQGKAYTPLAIK